jgi:hypothetical protein
MFKKKLRCNVCNKTFSNKKINIESVTKDKVQFRCECKNCDNVVMADVSIFRPTKHNKTSERKHQALQLKEIKTKKISSNDVLDVKNFLKGFKGDFKEIFRK